MAQIKCFFDFMVLSLNGLCLGLRRAELKITRVCNAATISVAVSGQTITAQNWNWLLLHNLKSLFRQKPACQGSRFSNSSGIRFGNSVNSFVFVETMRLASTGIPRIFPAAIHRNVALRSATLGSTFREG